jgi:hypothetical protein
VLVTTAFAAIATFGIRSSAFDQFVRVDPRQVGALVTLWVATALAYPALRRATAWFVDSVVLRRPDYRSLRATAGRRIQAHDAVAPLLSEIADLLTPAMSAREVSWHELSPAVDDDAGHGTMVVGDRAWRWPRRSGRPASRQRHPVGRRPSCWSRRRRRRAMRSSSPS